MKTTILKNSRNLLKNSIFWKLHSSPVLLGKCETKPAVKAFCNSFPLFFPGHSARVGRPRCSGPGPRVGHHGRVPVVSADPQPHVSHQAVRHRLHHRARLQSARVPLQDDRLRHERGQDELFSRNPRIPRPDHCQLQVSATSTYPCVAFSQKKALNC